ncbi:hypothetical protein [Sphingomonas sp. BAUL-RG-20F-R05-02]|uniref:hypothetical protein n=1 Tax=Sphingomonas sp. BAUL-RG-20F-R05-02 TaxID=2914830 RepID=UPI001F5976EB|nr:hypothetical protein [Sphingomonas sp. BAUL-RG-20F-R05-02]
MAKRPSLAESMKAAAKDPASATTPIDRDALPDKILAGSSLSGDTTASGYRAKTREGMKRLTVVVAPEEHRRVKRLSADTDRSIESLMREALANFLANNNA